MLCKGSHGEKCFLTDPGLAIILAQAIVHQKKIMHNVLNLKMQNNIKSQKIAIFDSNVNKNETKLKLTLSWLV